MKNYKKYIVATHNRVYGIPDALRDYLVEKKVETVAFIAHPLDKVPGDSFMQVYKRGKKVKEERIKRNQSLGTFNFVLDTLITIYWVIFRLPRFDVFVGNDNLNAFAGLVLRSLGKTKRSIYYAMDFSLDRLGNPLLNNIYHWTEVYCIKKSDEVWVTSLGIIYAREKHLGIKPEDYFQKVVPTGVWNEITKIKDLKDINLHHLFFIGHLLEKQGVQKVLKAIPLIVKEIRDFKFIVIGGGEYKGKLEKLSKSIKVDRYVEFAGIISDHKDVFEIMSISCVGIAPYKPEKDKSKNFTYFGDPGKIKDYLNAGLPVIMTDVSHNAKELEKAGCAIVVEYDEKEIAKAVVKIMKNTNSIRKYRKKALRKAKEYDWHAIFDRALIIK
jgi:glycosyltransferase involved in cell wall biosynthesis